MLEDLCRVKGYVRWTINKLNLSKPRIHISHVINCRDAVEETIEILNDILRDIT